MTLSHDSPASAVDLFHFYAPSGKFTKAAMICQMICQFHAEQLLPVGHDVSGANGLKVGS